MTVGGRPPHIQRCTYTEMRGGTRFQCQHPDPHPAGAGHYLGIDAEVFGRDLDKQSPTWLAATLRDREALLRNLRGRVDDVTGIAMDLAALYAAGGEPKEETARWLRTNHPTVAAQLGLS